jgi:hypothetical protein
VTQHAELTVEQWSRFELGQQILQIAAEMHRASESLRPERIESLRLSYERVLRLVDLTVEVHRTPNLRVELLRWRDVVAELYLDPVPDPQVHRLALKTLLWLHPLSAEQVEHLPA